MPSEKKLVQTLDLLTLPPAEGEIESLGPGASSRVDKTRSVIEQDNVVAVGISEKISDSIVTGKLALTFYVDKKRPLNRLTAEEVIPPALLLDINTEAVLTDVIEIGQPQLEMPASLPRSTKNPIQPGYSIGHFQGGAGTLGAIVKKKGKLFLLSNSHVLAESGKGKKGDKILFPGDVDGGILDDVIGELEDFIRFQTGGEMVNRADCAIAVPLPERLSNLVADIFEVGLPTGTLKAKRGMKVIKSGRTTHTTKAEIRDVNFRMTLKYPNGVGKVGFLDQVLCTRYTERGDSGSLVLEKESKKAVGLHFAGYPDEHGVQGSVFNPIQDVLKELEVRLVTKPLK